MEYLILDKQTDEIKQDTQLGESYYSYRFKKNKGLRKAKTGFRDFSRKLKVKKKKNKKRKLRQYKNRIPKKYSVYIKSKYWTKRKNEYFQKHGKQCCVCGSFKYVCLHHAKYNNGQFGFEPDDYMFPFCKDCHENFHKDRKTSSNMLADTLNFIQENYKPHDSILH